MTRYSERIAHPDIQVVRRWCGLEQPRQACQCAAKGFNFSPLAVAGINPYKAQIDRTARGLGLNYFGRPDNADIGLTIIITF